MYLFFIYITFYTFYIVLLNKISFSPNLWLSSNIPNSNVSYVVKSIGGVGPMTIAALAQNILKSYYFNQQDIKNREF